MAVQRRPRAAPLRDEVLRLLAEHRNRRSSVREIAVTVGCTHQYVYSLMPPHMRPGRPILERRLEAFLDEHPTAVLTKARGGMTFREIAAALGGLEGRADREHRPHRAARRSRR